MSHVSMTLPLHREVPGEHEPPHIPEAGRHAFEHVVCVAAGQPPPEQLAPLFSVFESAQLAKRHAVVGYAHAAGFVPSHEPPQLVPTPRQAVRAPCGAPVMAEQVPAALPSHA
jgi:hypothetical protein